MVWMWEIFLNTWCNLKSWQIKKKDGTLKYFEQIKIIFNNSVSVVYVNINDNYINKMNVYENLNRVQYKLHKNIINDETELARQGTFKVFHK